MNYKPIIGIIGKVKPMDEDDLWHHIDECDEFRYHVIKNGGIAITLLPTEKTLTFNDDDITDDTKLSDEEINDLHRQIDLCDGFILQGGLVSCNYEIEMARRIIHLNRPIIGICAGFNNILRALGTDVILDKTNSHDFYDANYRHNITIEKNTLIYDIVQKNKYNVNSIHSMVAPKDLVANYAKISSYSDDGLVESFEVTNKKFVVGIKWHPELMDDGFIDKLFEKFILKCKERQYE